MKLKQMTDCSNLFSGFSFIAIDQAEDIDFLDFFEEADFEVIEPKRITGDSDG